MPDYTEDEVREFIESHNDDDKINEAELRKMFRSVYGRPPDAEEERDMWSWICNGVSHS